MQVIKKYSSISAVDLLTVAKDIGIVLKDGNPDIVNHMIEIDSTRSRDREMHCNHTACCSTSDSGISAGDNIEAKIDRTDQQHPRNGDVGVEGVDQEQGQSLVDNRKKNKKKKK